MDLKLGGIYKTVFDERPFRIIGLDEHEVFYDCLWTAGKWTFSGNFKGGATFYRMPSGFFKAKSEFLELVPLTEMEFKYFRPDLPMRFGRVKEFSWSSNDLSRIHQLPSFLNLKLGIERLMLIPYGPKDGVKKGVVVENSNGLSEFEIIERALPIQQSVNSQESKGLGFYRSGFQRGLPTYVLGEYLDRAGIFVE